ARVERPEPAPPLDQLALLALGARDAGALGRFLLDVRALGVARAPHERPEPAGLADQGPAAPGAVLAGGLGLGRRCLALDGPGVLALGVVAAPDEEPVAAELAFEVGGLPPFLRAQGTELGEDHDGRLDLPLGPLDLLVERLVELPEDLDPWG